ncbi:succinate dehydrogenase cytochrome b subunit [Cellulomonas chengniuliangii]|uniref:Succinate dehydrogenase cytochrome b subunit n=1 Tax=Cellulomonas chengniuliangii TaxID=2968084 RepID=A0ABY5L1Y8_9CELL|nr:succinate dehydrogenase cytochrome b subunit [Cellulomonas chengniuliangii]MCC2308426.1 succinate dehydrogenase cytochrome b subunit [Cellulomonas chengniuliangii]MCC2317443.1 succinate dehydrogenase cytochrome b subunit [Cellulomonas chengniuliangii]UUI76802.1 succinate dehydrogenase cytochrome b subunit [Cellulomonas chengniuliangii]
MPSPITPGAEAGPATLPGSDPAALATGRVTNARIRKAPAVPSWVLKVVMAVTGTIFALFLLVHMFGNLKVFTGAEHFNEYAHWLHTILEPFLPWNGVLWILRVVLGASFVAHVVAAVLLKRRARASRGKVARKRMPLKTFAGRNMLVTGIVLFAFVGFHLMDLTIGTTGVAPETYTAGTTEASFAYQNLIASFQRPASSAFYIVALLTLFLHLAHGLVTVVHDLGMTGKRLRAVAFAVGGAMALAILLGNILIPIAVLTGIVK